ncbi:MAG: hypothetical protein M1826_000802 [Phylliscum demangeonii]|nr:MAG: hypothetical protein M1826_000802 [Phylliscum demangeonii]
MAAQSSMMHGMANSHGSGLLSLADLPTSAVFTSKLPPDPAFPTPADSHRAPRNKLGPRIVKGALFTFVRPEPQKEPELLAVSPAALRDLGLKPGEEETEIFRDVVAGNCMLGWDEERNDGVYPWAQCYGVDRGQASSETGFVARLSHDQRRWLCVPQLTDSPWGFQRAISLFEVTSPSTKVRYELQLKGAGQTPYSRFADGKAVLRSSIREFVVSEALNALGISSTRALSLTLLPHSQVRRERVEPGAIVARFAQSWIRIGTFDLLRARGDRGLVRQLATYVAEEVFGGWETLPSRVTIDADDRLGSAPHTGLPSSTVESSGAEEENRFSRLYREIVRRNARTVAGWQAYGFMNGVLNTDNTSIFGLSLDFGPFAFLDTYDPHYTPNHDDHMLRYCYRKQPSVIWWNLVRLGESLAEVIGLGAQVDDEDLVRDGVDATRAAAVIARAETIIKRAGQEYQAVYRAEYHRLMTARLGLRTQPDDDGAVLFQALTDTMEVLQLDFHHTFRTLSTVSTAELASPAARNEVAARFFPADGLSAPNVTAEAGRARVAEWLERWRDRVVTDWGSPGAELTPEQDEARTRAMKAVNPKFVPRSWILEELIRRVERDGERDILRRILHMALHPFEDRWGWDDAEEDRFCGDVPRLKRAMQCSCSS